MDIVIYKLALCLRTATDNLIDLLFSPIWTIYNIVTGIITICKADVAAEGDEDAPAEEPHHITGFGKKK